MATVSWDIPASDNWEEWRPIFAQCNLFCTTVRNLEARIIAGEITRPEAARTLRRAVETWQASQTDDGGGDDGGGDDGGGDDGGGAPPFG